MTSDTELSVEENLIIFAKLYGVPRERRKRLIDELLAAVELTEWRDKQVMYLSGGMRRRVEIARGLVHEPRIFFLDEPTTGSTRCRASRVWEMMQKIKRERDLTVLLTTHYMDEADRLCDRIAIVDHGKLVALDSPLKLKASIPSHNVHRGQLLDACPPDWAERLERCRTWRSVTVDGQRVPDRDRQRAGDHDGAGDRRRGGRRGRAVAGGARARRLDDVFVHYTGHDLRDALQDPAPRRVRSMRAGSGRNVTCIAPWPSSSASCGASAAARSLIVMSLIFPLVQLDRAGLRLRRQREAPEGRPSSIRTTACRR